MHNTLVSSENSTNLVKYTNRKQKMNRKPDLKNYESGFVPDEVRSLNPRGRKEEKLPNWQGTSYRKESLSDPQWHKRPPTTEKVTTTTSTTTPKNVKDARELLSSGPPVKNFPKKFLTKKLQKQTSNKNSG